MPDRSQRLGRYELVKRIGQGGMGVVYLAHDPLLDRNVAIKLLAIESSELRERFGREARAAGSLNHPNIVHVYDVGEDEGRSFIAMEYVAGETLADVINRNASLKLSRKLTITLELCAGLAHAHRMGIVHRDVKPANVMLDESGTVKILDFGLARPLVLGAPGLTRNSQMIGTPHYMAPEQIQGGVIDKRTDVYGVGLVLYELLAYVKAYPGDAPYSVILRVMNEEPEALERLCPDLDPSLPDIVRRASDKIPGRRYDDLSRMISGPESGSAAPPALRRRRHDCHARGPSRWLRASEFRERARCTSERQSGSAGEPDAGEVHPRGVPPPSCVHDRSAAGARENPPRPGRVRRGSRGVPTRTAARS